MLKRVLLLLLSLSSQQTCSAWIVLSGHTAPQTTDVVYVLQV